MNILPEEIIQERPGNLRESITRYFRNGIRSGRLAAGCRLPTNRELAEMLHTSAPNVHAALSPLLSEGLIRRDRKTGTVVAFRPARLERAAIYIHHSSLDDLPPFQRTLLELVRRELNGRSIESRFVNDNGTDFGYEQLKHWCADGEIQGVAVPFFNRDRELFERLLKLPVPLSAMDGTTRCGSVGIDHGEIVRAGVRALETMGARRIGLLTSAERRGPDGSLGEYHRIYHDEAVRRGLSAPDRLVFAVNTASEYLKSSDSLTDFAYQRCEKLFAMPRAEWPDGLLVIPDQLSNGVMLSLLKNRIRVPDDLKLVIHRDWEIPRTLLVPCRMVGIAIADAARALVENLCSGFAGAPAREIVIEPEIRIFNPESEERP